MSVQDNPLELAEVVPSSERIPHTCYFHLKRVKIATMTSGIVRPYFEISTDARRVSALLGRGAWLLYRLDSACLVAGKYMQLDDYFKDHEPIAVSVVHELIAAGFIRPLPQFRSGYLCGWSELLVDVRDGHTYDVYGLCV